jgi:hypothetical protein
MLVVATGALPPRSFLRKPRACSLMYVQKGATWQRYPEGAALMPDSVEITNPAPNGKIRVKYWEGSPAEFTFFVPSGETGNGR